MLVDRLDAEGQHQSPAASRALEAPDARAKLLDTGTVTDVLMSLATGLENSMFLFVLIMRRESIESGGRRKREGWTSFCHFPVNIALAATLGCCALQKNCPAKESSGDASGNSNPMATTTSCEQDRKVVPWTSCLILIATNARRYLEKLNPEQRRAVEHDVRENDAAPGTPLLVIAGRVRQDQHPGAPGGPLDRPWRRSRTILLMTFSAGRRRDGGVSSGSRAG